MAEEGDGGCRAGREMPGKEQVYTKKGPAAAGSNIGQAGTITTRGLPGAGPPCSIADGTREGPELVRAGGAGRPAAGLVPCSRNEIADKVPTLTVTGAASTLIPVGKPFFRPARARNRDGRCLTRDGGKPYCAGSTGSPPGRGQVCPEGSGMSKICTPVCAGKPG